MDFYSFSFGEMQVAQADASSPKIVAMDVRVAFSDPKTKGAHLLTVHVQVPDGADMTIDDLQKEAFRTAQQVLRVAVRHCEGKTPEQLKETSEKQLIATNAPS